MLPASTGERKQRDVSKGRPDGRIGRDPAADRALAARRDRLQGARRADDLHRLRRAAGRRRHPLRVDHRRDGGAAARVRPADARSGKLERSPLTGTVAAVSCGIVDGVALLDLDYSEDSTAEVDANVVMTGDGGLVEVQATAERTPLSRAHLDDLLALAAQRDRIAAHAAGRGGRHGGELSRWPAPVALVLWRPATRTSCGSSAGCWRRPGCGRAAARRRRAAARGRRDVRRQRAAQGARRGGGDRPARDRRRLGDRGRRRSAGARACARRATPASTPPTRRTSTS